MDHILINVYIKSVLFVSLPQARGTQPSLLKVFVTKGSSAMKNLPLLVSFFLITSAAVSGGSKRSRNEDVRDGILAGNDGRDNTDPPLRELPSASHVEERPGGDLTSILHEVKEDVRVEVIRGDQTVPGNYIVLPPQLLSSKMFYFHTSMRTHLQYSHS